eukprot:8109252-Pyramimonas_sp.AAC.1
MRGPAARREASLREPAPASQHARAAGSRYAGAFPRAWPRSRMGADVTALRLLSSDGGRRDPPGNDGQGRDAD